MKHLALLITLITALAVTTIQAQPAPPSPTDSTFTSHWQTTTISWLPIPGAEFYQVHHSHGPISRCTIATTAPNGCTLLTTSHHSLSFTHQNPALPHENNRYHVTACTPASLCTPVLDTPPAIYADTSPAPLSEGAASYHIQTDTARVAWTPAPDATHYNVLWTPYQSANCAFARCDTLAALTTNQFHTHELANPSSRDPQLTNHYFVQACNPGGCAHPTPALFVDNRPGRIPTITAALQDHQTITLHWTPQDDATHYRVYHGGDLATTCRLQADGQPDPCLLLQDLVPTAAYLHLAPNPEPDRNSYWISACNAAGCTAITPRGTRPTAPNSAPAAPATPLTNITDKLLLPPTPSPLGSLKPQLQLSQTTLHTGEALLATLTLTNTDPSRTFDIFLSISAPDGWSITNASPGTTCLQSACHTNRETPPGYTAAATAVLTPNDGGRHHVSAEATWRDAAAPQAPAAHSALSASVNVVGTDPALPPEPTQPAPTPGTTGCSRLAVGADVTLIAALLIAILAIRALKRRPPKIPKHLP